MHQKRLGSTAVKHSAGYIGSENVSAAIVKSRSNERCRHWSFF